MQIWNSLPLDLRNSETVDVFKNNLKTFLFHRDIDKLSITPAV